MSAFIAVAFEDRVELLTDGAICDEETGQLLAVRRKVWHSDTIPIAVTGRGTSGAVASICNAIIVAAEAEGGFDPAMAWLIDMLADRRQLGSEAKVEIVIVGIAESRGPVVLYFSTGEGQSIDGNVVEPWVLTDMAGEAAAGGDPQIDPALMNGVAFVVAGSMVMEGMRKTQTNDVFRPGLSGNYSVGGCIDYTVVTAAGVEVKRIHEWPDEIGQPVDPFRATAAAA